MLGAILIFAIAADPKSTASMICDAKQVRPGQSFTVAITIHLPKGWHTYWVNPGDSGVAPTIKWSLPKEWKAGPLVYPTPSKFESSEIIGYGYEMDVTFLTKITSSYSTMMGRPAHLGADLAWLYCQGKCIPAKAKLSLDIPVGASVVDEISQERIMSLKKTFPASAPENSFEARNDHGQIEVTSKIALDPGTEFFSEDSIIEPSATQVLHTSAKGSSLQLKVAAYAPAKVTKLNGVLKGLSGGKPFAYSISVPIVKKS